jgi:hypothetical protein
MLFFGLQLRGFIAGLLFAYFVIPFVQRALINKTARPAAA